MAVGGLVVLICLCLSQFLDVSGTYPKYLPLEEAEQFSRLGAGAQNVKARTPCSLMRSREDSNLCASWEATDAAKRTSRWTFYQMVIGLGGIIGLILTLRSANQQNQRAAEEFVAANPPALRFDQIEIEFEKWFAGEPFEGRIYVRNDGRNTAVIANIRDLETENYGNVILYIGRHPPIADPYKDHPDQNPFPESKIRPGDGKFWPLSECALSADEVNKVINRRSALELFVIGRVHYRDTRGNPVQNVFCRKFDKKLKRFVRAVDYPEYEY